MNIPFAKYAKSQSESFDKLRTEKIIEDSISSAIVSGKNLVVIDTNTITISDEIREELLKKGYTVNQFTTKTFIRW
jgi:hypothetical protein